MDELSIFKIKPGSTVIDLGAGTGISTLKLAKMVGPNGLVIALTPVFENYRKLVAALIKNKIENVVPLMYAASNATIFDWIDLSDNPVSHSMIYPRTGNKRPVVTVEWHLLMEMLQLKHLDFALIDVEGCEVKVLDSMARRLGVREPHVLPDKIVLEEHLRHEPKPEETLQQIYELLDKLGYTKRIKKSIYIFAEHKSTFSGLRLAFLAWLKDQAEKVKGTVYNVGSGPDWFNYRRFFPKATSYFNVDKLADVNVDIVADVENMEPIKKQTANCVVASFILGVVENVDNALREIHRVLKADGVILATFIGWGYKDKMRHKFTEAEATEYMNQYFTCDVVTPYKEQDDTVCTFIKGRKERHVEN